MKLLFELSKEHDILPRDEVVACLKAEGINFKIIDSNMNALVIQTETTNDAIKNLANRLSYTFYVDELFFSCSHSLTEIKKYAKETIPNKKGSIAITCKNRSTTVDSRPILKTLAEIYSKGRPVDLDHPKYEIRILLTDLKVYVGLKIMKVDRSQFEKRKAPKRPFFSPISLHPRLARLLVNLSAINREGTLLDPFCGTGGILLEAGIIGVRLIGSDIEEKMIDGCKKTLDFYKIKKYELYCSDVGEISKFATDVDAIVTDLPYGKSTTTKGENIIHLYRRAFECIYEVLKNDGVAVVGSSNSDILSIGEEYFLLANRYKLRVHRSLTRYFAVYQK